jgi:NAD(P)-dependent dehydrogenase (short-subunit alcohol dehydrogenase family)
VAGPLEGLVAVVTGGSGHIGSAVCATLAHQGAKVVVADINVAGAAGHDGDESF